MLQSGVLTLTRTLHNLHAIGDFPLGHILLGHATNQLGSSETKTPHHYFPLHARPHGSCHCWRVCRTTSEMTASLSTILPNRGDILQHAERSKHSCASLSTKRNYPVPGLRSSSGSSVEHCRCFILPYATFGHSCTADCKQLRHTGATHQMRQCPMLAVVLPSKATTADFSRQN